MQTQLAAFRRYDDISQKEMAAHIGVDERTYHNKENGHTDFKLSEVYLIAEKLNRPISDIFLPPDFKKLEVLKVEE